MARIKVADALMHLHAYWRIDVLIHGAARGADTLASDFAKAHGIKVEGFPADWGKHGKRAGWLRNKQMLDEALPHLVVAFPGGTGTRTMIELAFAQRVPVWEPYGVPASCWLPLGRVIP